MNDNTYQDNHWYQQDVLKLSVKNWKDLLVNINIFHKEDIDMILFVYYQDNHQSTATEIGNIHSVHVNKITAQNRVLSKRIYKHFSKTPPPNQDGGTRYWNVVFDGNKDKQKMKDDKGHWVWVLRPNLVEAIKELLLTSDYLSNYFIYDYEHISNVSDNNIHIEGERLISQLYKYERNPVVRRKCIEKHGVKCKICGFDFGKIYGKLAQGKIHVHHIVPLSKTKSAHATNPDIDLIPICPNCHYVVHLKTPPYTPEEVMAFLKNHQT